MKKLFSIIFLASSSLYTAEDLSQQDIQNQKKLIIQYIDITDIINKPKAPKNFFDFSKIEGAVDQQVVQSVLNPLTHSLCDSLQMIQKSEIQDKATRIKAVANIVASQYEVMVRAHAIDVGEWSAQQMRSFLLGGGALQHDAPRQMDILTIIDEIEQLYHFAQERNIPVVSRTMFDTTLEEYKQNTLDEASRKGEIITQVVEVVQEKLQNLQI